MNQYTIAYGRNKIKFLLRQTDRKTLTISVSPDLSVMVSSPQHIPIRTILNRVQKRAGWIINKIEYFKDFQPLRPPKEYVSGETHRYLGRQYRLKVVANGKSEVKMKGPYLFLYTKSKDNTRRNKKLLYGWYRERAMDRFEATFNALLKRLQKYGINSPALKIKTMKARWGSCSAKKETVTLNTELIKAPSHCIEYVIMHELCHMKYPSHNRHFYDFLALVMPDWIERKRRLERVVL